jgi:hypothetical protein
MTILTTFRERVCRSFMTLNTGFFPLAILLFFCSFEKTSAQCTGNTVINIDASGGAITFLWGAPATGGPFNVQITAIGGSGGGVQGGNLGGGGAEVIGTFEVQNNEKLFAIAGSAGGSGTVANHAGGGGAASGVVNCGIVPNCATGAFLIIAAGGNGGQVDNAGLGGLNVTGGTGDGGLGGGVDGGGGGAGDSDDGDNGASGSRGFGGNQAQTTGIVLGGTGSNGTNKGGDGMGGGGGGGLNSSEGSGGGAGQTGASAGNTASATSFNSGNDQDGLDGGQGVPATPGSVVAVCLGPVAPVKLIHFKVHVLDNDVKLIWSTATEKDNLGFNIERSVDNRNWTTLGFVPGNGTTTHQQNYTYADVAPLDGVNYYRLKQMDTDGKHEYSPIVVADLKASTLQFDVFPNPSTDGALTFRTVSKQEGDALLEIWDWAGHKVWKETHRLWEGTTVWPVSMVNFPKGAYTARLQMPDGTAQFRKIVLQ